MEFWIGIILDTICANVNPLGISYQLRSTLVCDGHQFRSGTSVSKHPVLGDAGFSVIDEKLQMVFFSHILNVSVICGSDNNYCRRNRLSQK